MIGYAGWWAVAETGQGGGLPDTLHGPYWSQDEATEVANTMTTERTALGRRDGFDVCQLLPVDDDWDAPEQLPTPTTELEAAS